MEPTPSIRPARDRADMDACVDLQRAVWGVNDLEVTGAIQLIATVHAGGLLLVAEESPGQIVGFSYAFPGFRNGGPHLHSDMLAVLPAARGRGLGTRLKWAQREEALRRGIALVTWTFDPLQAGNARLNLRHLGATADELLPDFYGTTSSALHHGLPTDRLGVRWELGSPSVRERAGEKTSRPAAALLDAPAVLLEIPDDWNALVRTAPDAAAAWPQQVREALGAYFARGYRATDLLTVMESGRPRPRYVLYRF